jgi:hypothetical protein
MSYEETIRIIIKEIYDKAITKLDKDNKIYLWDLFDIGVAIARKHNFITYDKELYFKSRRQFWFMFIYRAKEKYIPELQYKLEEEFMYIEVKTKIK